MPPDPPLPEPLELVSLRQEAVPGGWGEPIRRLIRDEEAWQATWAELWPGRPEAAEVPAIDFERSMVLAVALPTQHCHARITVRQVDVEGNALRVDLLEELADPQLHCFVGTRPFHAVRLPRHPGEADFRSETRIYSPEPQAESGRQTSGAQPRTQV